MARVIKIGKPQTSTPSIANQFKTSRKSTTNPFNYHSFEGNTLDVTAFADVFGTSTVKETSKIKLIAASVAGSMHKIRTSITEPIINFVNRVYGRVSSAWDYAKNTNISDVGVFKNINSGIQGIVDFMNQPIEIPGSHVVDSAISGFKTHIVSFNDGVLDLGKDFGTKWSSFVSKFSNKSKISADMPVVQLEQMLQEELSKYAEAA